MNRYSARTSDRYSGGGSAATGSAATTATTTAEGREQRAESREQRVEVENTSQVRIASSLSDARFGDDAMGFER